MNTTGDPKSKTGPKGTVKVIDIKTDLWHKIIDTLIEKYGWVCTDQYDGMDAGIDYNSYTLEKGDHKVKFEWYNWTEGEFTCSYELLKEIEKLTGQSFNTER